MSRREQWDVDYARKLQSEEEGRRKIFSDEKLKSAAARLAPAGAAGKAAGKLLRSKASKAAKSLGSSSKS
jgi:hypothetical protein